MRFFQSPRHVRHTEHFDPDEVILDAFNLPAFDQTQFEGRVVQPVSRGALFGMGVVIVCIVVAFAARAFELQIKKGETYHALSEKNRLTKEVRFAERGVIYDRFGRELVWNENFDEEHPGDLPLRRYEIRPGFGLLLGYVSYPETDASGKWWRLAYKGVAGMERRFNELLSGTNGHILTEVDAAGNVQHEQMIEEPIAGMDVYLTIDADVQAKLYEAIKNGAERSHFTGGAAGIIDVHTGEMLALTSYPEYSSQVLSDGNDHKTITGYNTSPGKPFLNRPFMGEYAPGSIVKPYVSLAALSENIITPDVQILSTGSLTVPNPYNPALPTVFRDWKAHGWVNMYEAIANSSDVYFYEVGGGFGTQKGLGIAKLDQYAHMFGFGEQTGFDYEYESAGNVPTPEWKETVFGEDNPWRIGDTYHTSIGQFGFLVTPLQVLRYTAALANNGTLFVPRIALVEPELTKTVPIAQSAFDVVHEGMRRATDHGTGASLNMPGFALATKTGTAEVGARNERMNSWVIGYWPCSRTKCEPQFAFFAMLEHAPANTLAGAAPSMRPFFEWLVENESDYANGRYPDKQVEKSATSQTP